MEGHIPMGKKLVTLLCLTALLLSGCATIKLDSRTANYQVEMTSKGERQYEVVSNFKVNDKAGWVLGLIPVNKPAGDNHTYLADLIDKQVQAAGGDAAINVTIRAQFQFVDILVNAVTLGAYLPRTVTVSGDIIKYRE